jgi:hypothetical protein
VGGIGFMVLPLLGTIGIPGSELFPTPDAVGVALLGVVGVYMAIGIAGLWIQRVRRLKLIAHMQDALEAFTCSSRRRESTP